MIPANFISPPFIHALAACRPDDRTTGVTSQQTFVSAFHRMVVMSFSSALMIWLTPEGRAGQESTSASDEEKRTSKGTYYQDADSYSTRCDPDPPKCSRTVADTVLATISDWTWLDIWLDYRFRYKYRDHDSRRRVGGLDEPMQNRTRVYLGGYDQLDPLRFPFEMQDARRYNENFPKDNRDIKEFKVIRLYVELYFEDLLGRDAFGNGRPLSVRYGIHTFEFLDRRLIGNNQWRNTANTFQGFQAALGQEVNDLQIDLLAVQPLERRLYEGERPMDEQWVWAAIGPWRGWSDLMTLEPFNFAFTDSNVENGGRQVHSPGLRAYGRFGESGFDFDVDGSYQCGSNGNQDVSAWAATAEVGCRWSAPWKPRFSVFYGQVTDYADPNDGVDSRFERFFGFARPWSANDYIIFENIRTPKLRLELTSHEKCGSTPGTVGIGWTVPRTGICSIPCETYQVGVGASLLIKLPSASVSKPLVKWKSFWGMLTFCRVNSLASSSAMKTPISPNWKSL